MTTQVTITIDLEHATDLVIFATIFEGIERVGMQAMADAIRRLPDALENLAGYLDDSRGDWPDLTGDDKDAFEEFMNIFYSS